MGWICFGLFLVALAVDNGLCNIARALLAGKLAEAGMNPEEAMEYFKRLKKAEKDEEVVSA